MVLVQSSVESGCKVGPALENPSRYGGRLKGRSQDIGRDLNVTWISYAVPAFFCMQWDGTMFASCAFAEAIGSGSEAFGEFDSVDSIVEVEMSSSQPLPEFVGILHGKYLVGSNESKYVWMVSQGKYRVISMETLYDIYREPAPNHKSRLARHAKVIEASEPFEV